MYASEFEPTPFTVIAYANMIYVLSLAAVPNGSLNLEFDYTNISCRLLVFYFLSTKLFNWYAICWLIVIQNSTWISYNKIHASYMLDILGLLSSNRSDYWKQWPSSLCILGKFVSNHRVSYWLRSSRDWNWYLNEYGDQLQYRMMLFFWSVITNIPSIFVRWLWLLLCCLKGENLNKALNKAIPRSGLSFLEAGILTLAYLMFFTQGEQEMGKKRVANGMVIKSQMCSWGASFSMKRWLEDGTMLEPFKPCRDRNY